MIQQQEPWNRSEPNRPFTGTGTRSNSGVEEFARAVMEKKGVPDIIGRMLEGRHRHLYWSPCAAHCVDLMLEDIAKIPNIMMTIKRAIMLNGYIYNRSGLLNMMRRYTGHKELLKLATTRFATSFIMLSSIHRQKDCLRKMFTSQEWTSSKWAKEIQGKNVAHIVLMPTFWTSIVYSLKVASPLVHVLKLVDGERRPPMGYSYEAMERAKEAIAKAFGGNEEKYKDIFEIIDERWNIQLHRPLYAAGYFLNPEYFYSNPNIEQDEEVMGGLYQCIERLVPTTEVQDKISLELSRYMKADGLFGSSIAIRQRKSRASVNNAGTINRNNRIWEVPEEECETVIDTNVKGVPNMLCHFIPLMIETKQGIIVNMSSGWGRSAAAQVAPYCASKWAVEGLPRSVAKELPSGMAIVALNPGLINTDMLASCFGSSAALYQTPESCYNDTQSYYGRQWCIAHCVNGRM